MKNSCLSENDEQQYSIDEQLGEYSTIFRTLFREDIEAVLLWWEDFGGLSPPNKALRPPNWNMKHHKYGEFCQILECQAPLHKCKSPVFNIFWLGFCIEKKPKGPLRNMFRKISAVCCKNTGLRISITLDMRKDRKTHKKLFSLAVMPQWHLANNDSAVCFKAAFPTSELKAHRPTYFWKMVRLINLYSKFVTNHLQATYSW